MELICQRLCLQYLDNNLEIKRNLLEWRFNFKQHQLVPIVFHSKWYISINNFFNFFFFWIERKSIKAVDEFLVTIPTKDIQQYCFCFFPYPWSLFLVHDVDFHLVVSIAIGWKMSTLPMFSFDIGRKKKNPEWQTENVPIGLGCLIFSSVSMCIFFFLCVCVCNILYVLTCYPWIVWEKHLRCMCLVLCSVTSGSCIEYPWYRSQ